MTWQSAANGIENIIPGTSIAANTASVTFTVDGAKFQGDSASSITAKLTRGSDEKVIESSRIIPAINSNTVTVDLQGLTLPQGEYTLELSIPGRWLDRETERYVTDTNTATATFTVKTKEVTLGDTTSSPLTFTSGTALDTEGVKVSFPATGIAGLNLTEEGKKATATISGDGSSGLTATVTTECSEGSVSAVKVTLSDTPTTAGTYTVTLTIPKDGITTKDGYTVPDGGFLKTFDFTVKPVSTTTPVTVGDPSVYSLIVFQGDDLNESPKTITFTTTGVKTMDASKVTVSMSEVSTITSSVNFTPPTSGATGTLTITFKGSVPADATVTGSGLSITIPTDAFTSYVDGYGAPGEDYQPDQGLKLDVQSPLSSGT